MAKKRIGNQSKRITCHKRYKIEKKVREHHRKVRKDLKKNPGKHKRKDPGVPNTLPFKADMLEHIVQTKQKLKEVPKAVPAMKKRNKSKQKEKISTNEMSETVKLRTFLKEFNKVVQEADVILEVLDARDPLGTRCFQAEEKIKLANKRLVLIINKADLVPRQNMKDWLTYLRHFYPTLPFKANTQQQADRLGQVKSMFASSDYKGSQSLGVEGITSILANYCRVLLGSSGGGGGAAKESSVGRLTVGVIGLPNTGKSALINSLLRRRACLSGSVPGQTRECQEVRLDKRIILLDTPGIVLSQAADPCDLVLRNCLRVESLADPLPAVEAIIRRCPKTQLMLRYGLGEEDVFSDSREFLARLAKRMGRLKKGGAPDLLQAGRRVIQDWISGRISYCTVPPELTETATASAVPVEVGHEPDLFPFPEFDAKVLNALHEMDPQLPDAGPVLPPSAPLTIQTEQELLATTASAVVHAHPSGAEERPSGNADNVESGTGGNDAEME